jgi:hypothetical protein
MTPNEQLPSCASFLDMASLTRRSMTPYPSATGHLFNGGFQSHGFSAASIIYIKSATIPRKQFRLAHKYPALGKITKEHSFAFIILLYIFKYTPRGGLGNVQILFRKPLKNAINRQGAKVFKKKGY